MTARTAPRRLDARAVPGQWRSQVVGDGVTGAAYPGNQLFDAVEHAVERGAERAKLVAAVIVWNAVAQVAVDDGTGDSGLNSE